MLHYRHIILSVFTKEIEPLLKEISKPALTSLYGEQWYQVYGKGILEGYKDFQKANNKIEAGIEPLEAMDISALFFLLYPYETRREGDHKQYIQHDGAMVEIAKYYQWEDWQISRMNRVRTIRNNATHDECDNEYVPDKAYLLAGTQERIWLNDLEDIFKRIRASFNLAEYHTQLHTEIQQKIKEEGSNHRISFFMSDAEDVRNAYCKIHKFDFSEAPIGEPLTGAAPWTSSNADLEDLPWPSTMVTEKMNTWTEKTGSNYKDDMTVVDEKIQETVNKAFDQIDKGMSKLFGWLGGKK